MFGLLVAMLTAFSPSTPTDATARAGLNFGDHLSKRERDAARVSFEQVLPKACDPVPCTRKCTDEQPSLGVTIDGEDRNYTLSWAANDPRLDAPLTLESSCELCSLVELEAQLATDMSSLCTRLGALDSAPGSARVTAAPDRATVRIDGHRRGRTPWVGELDPGAHRIQVGARGYGSETRTLQIYGGIEESAHFELLPISGGVRPAWPGWTQLGLGVALGIAGTALIALDGKDWRGRCSGSDIDTLGNCRYVYSTQSLGIGLAVVGAAALATGVGLLVWSQGQQHGGGIAWRGRF